MYDHFSESLREDLQYGPETQAHGPCTIVHGPCNTISETDQGTQTVYKVHGPCSAVPETEQNLEII